MKIGVLGAGSMGSLFGGLLSLAGSEVWLIDIREDHIQAILDHGLIVESNKGKRVATPKATTRPQVCGPVELLIVFVKAIHTAAAMATADPLLDNDTLVLSLQNGLGNLEIIADKVGRHRVIAGVTYEGARTVGPGHVYHQVEARTIVGPHAARGLEETASIVDLFRCAGLPAELRADIQGLVWSKAVINISVTALTALTGLKFSEIVSSPEATKILETTIDECLRVTQTLGITLEYHADPLGQIKAHLQRIGPNKSSMLQDMEQGRKSEIEALNGMLVAYARQVGIPTPVNEMLVYLIQAIERSRGYSSASMAS
jgi:2-dehydropantoate 2-reductase